MTTKNDSHLSQGSTVKDSPQSQHKRMACGVKISGTENPNGGEADKKSTIANGKGGNY